MCGASRFQIDCEQLTSQGADDQLISGDGRLGKHRVIGGDKEFQTPAVDVQPDHSEPVGKAKIYCAPGDHCRGTDPGAGVLATPLFHAGTSVNGIEVGSAVTDINAIPVQLWRQIET